MMAPSCRARCVCVCVARCGNFLNFWCFYWKGCKAALARALAFLVFLLMLPCLLVCCVRRGGFGLVMWLCSAACGRSHRSRRRRPAARSRARSSQCAARPRVESLTPPSSESHRSHRSSRTGRRGGRSRSRSHVAQCARSANKTSWKDAALNEAPWPEHMSQSAAYAAHSSRAASHRRATSAHARSTKHSSKRAQSALTDNGNESDDVLHVKVASQRASSAGQLASATGHQDSPRIKAMHALSTASSLLPIATRQARAGTHASTDARMHGSKAALQHQPDRSAKAPARARQHAAHATRSPGTSPHSAKHEGTTNQSASNSWSPARSRSSVHSQHVATHSHRSKQHSSRRK